MLVLDACISQMIGPVQSSIHTLTVLGFGDEQDKERVFMAVLQKGYLTTAFNTSKFY